MKHVLLFCFLLFHAIAVSAQMSVEEVNRKLDTNPYYSLRLGYDSDISLPDSIRAKMINALQRVLPRQYADSVFTLPQAVLDNVEKYARTRCKTDTLCYEKTYAERYEMNLQNIKDNQYNRCYSISLVLACGSWGITESIPYLEEELKNPRCQDRQRVANIEMALAKLDDSHRQAIMDKYTLSYILAHTPLDTVNNQVRMSSYVFEQETAWPIHEGLAVGMYLESKEIVLNIVDLMFLKGEIEKNIGDTFFFMPEGRKD